MTLKYRLILLLAVLVGVLAAVTIQSAKAAPTTCIDSPKSELNQSSVSEYKTLLFVLNDVESNNTEHTIYKEINEYYQPILAAKPHKKALLNPKDTVLSYYYKLFDKFQFKKKLIKIIEKNLTREKRNE